jgi:predicted SAM-dependent methyltransferase
VFLNLGSHGDNLNGYLNIDFDHPTADIKADVSNLPFRDNSIHKILAYHILEHFRSGTYEPHLSNPLNPKTAIEVLTEWKRVLRVDGILEIKIPDFEKVVWLYYHFPEWARTPGANAPFGNFSDWLCSNGQHQLISDKTTMLAALRSVGFRDIVFRDPPPSRVVDRTSLEMYVICKK